ncbi:hypothetical protein M422DRAFT_58965 [Sphaerobolus stellatus SS14]|nr:hypothetical protein M422DRAFT_58965 [Sphaerobolus stellatus SS14]
MHILVTGCNGDVGLKVVERALADGHSVLGVDKGDSPAGISHSKFIFHKADVCDHEVVMKLVQGCDAIVHLAALRWPGDYLFEAHNTNVVSSWNILRAAAEHKIRRIALASSVNAIGLVYSANPPTFDYFPVDENHPCRPDEPYGLSKQICELQADTIVRRYPFMRVASLRLHWVLPDNGRALRLSEETGAKQLWGWVHNEEVARAFLLAVATENENFQGHEAFFIVASELANQGYAEELAKKFHPTVPFRRELKGKDGFWDCSKAEKLLGWKHVSP